MAKKEKFSVDASALFGDMSKEDIREAATRRPGRPKNENLVRDNTMQRGLTSDMTRQTFILPVEQVETLKNYAYTERKKIKDIIQDALQEYIDNHVDKDNLLIRPDDWR